MIVTKIANSKNDEFYTPAYAVKPIMKYLKPNSTIWCPFDTKESLFYKLFTEAGHKVYATHISEGNDFFEMECPVGVQYIISNPPYSIKSDILERLFSFNVPFAMLLGLMGLFESQRRFNMFKDHQFEIMYLNKRVAYFKDYETQAPLSSGNPPYPSGYLCSGMLPKQIVFEEIHKTK